MLRPPSTPSSSPLGSFPVAAATLPAQEKRCGRRMSGDGTRDRGGHAAGAGGLASRCLLQHGTLFYTGAKRTIPHVLYLSCFVYNCHRFEFFVYFVKKTGGLGGFFFPRLLFSACQLCNGHWGCRWVCRAGAVTGVPASTRCGSGMLPSPTLNFQPH